MQHSLSSLLLGESYELICCTGTQRLLQLSAHECAHAEQATDSAQHVSQRLQHIPHSRSGGRCVLVACDSLKWLVTSCDAGVQLTLDESWQQDADGAVHSHQHGVQVAATDNADQLQLPTPISA